MQQEKWFTFVKEALTSKKFWIMVAAVVGGFATEGKAFVNKAVLIVTGYVVAQGAADLGTALANGKKEQSKP